MNKESPKEPKTPSRQGRPGNFGPTLLVIVGISLTGTGLYRHFFSGVNPPNISTKDVDPAIVHAIETARQNIVASPKSGVLWGDLGMVLLAHGFGAPATEALTKAHEFDDQNPAWLYLHARAIAAKFPEKSIDLLNQAVALCGNKPDSPRLSLVELLLDQNRLDEAERHLQEFAVSDKDNVRAQHATARLHFLRGEFEECKKTIINSQKQIAGRYNAAKEKAQSLSQQGKQKDANIELTRANRRLANDLSKQSSLGKLLAKAKQELGDPTAAQELARAERQPDRNWADPYTSQVAKLRTGLEAMLFQSNRAFGIRNYQKSVTILEATVKRYPDSLLAYIHLGRGYIRLGRTSFSKGELEKAKEHYHVARKHLHKALELDGESVEALFRLGVAYADHGDIDGDVEKFKEAESLYRRAIELKSDFTMAYYNLSNSLDRQGRLTEAIEALKNVTRLEPKHANAYYILGTLFAKAKEYSDAEKSLKLAVELNPKNTAAQQALQEVLSRQRSE